ncbi:hypothetical protein [Pasteurella phage PHB01]|uniref:Uncharacterized protein n=1 Tax=Pasteurella phage PHB01 TaxID=2006930 RepID=A0A218M4H6_9CAUD|nr:hypothetical protein HOR83_gp42 [Pasteurella phage PHB01]ASD51055.1 hypothetical protein [Pasteurella phage PHB01]
MREYYKSTKWGSYWATPLSTNEYDDLGGLLEGNAFFNPSRDVEQIPSNWQYLGTEWLVTFSNGFYKRFQSDEELFKFLNLNTEKSGDMSWYLKSPLEDAGITEIRRDDSYRVDHPMLEELQKMDAEDIVTLRNLLGLNDD